SGGRDAAAQRLQMVPGDGLVGDHDRLPAPHQGQDLLAGAGDQAGTDGNVVAPLGELDTQPFDRGIGHYSPSASGGSSARGVPASAATTRAAVASGGPSPLSIVTSASA